ncbi:MAG: hypothetical protein ACI8SE_000172 [Bacteroidia bacterium]|jgi:hypothetical protein
MAIDITVHGITTTHTDMGTRIIGVTTTVLTGTIVGIDQMFM